MTAQPTSQLMTVEDFWELPDRDDVTQELVRGVVRDVPKPGHRHGRVVVRVSVLLDGFVRPRGLGDVVGEVGCHVEVRPDTMIAPDVAFVSTARIPADETRWVIGAPDLAVEVLSPTDRPGAVAAKSALWMDSGVRLLWVVDPARETVRVHAPGVPSYEVGVEGVLDGCEVLPGLELSVAELFG